MPETVLLIPPDMAPRWREVSASLPKPVFRSVYEREEELIDLGEVAMVGLQVAGYVADVSAVAMLLLPSVRQFLDRRRTETEDPRLALRRRDGDEPAFWVVLDGEMSDEELRSQIERFIQARPDDDDQAPR